MCERIANLQPLGRWGYFFHVERSEAIGLEIRRDSEKGVVRVRSSSRMAGAGYDMMGAKGKASEASQALYFRVVETIRFSSA